jgi:hypothetical protein
MNTVAEQSINKLLELLQRKENLLQDILALTEAQTSTITEEGLDNLHILINEKQAKIDEIERLDKDFSETLQCFKNAAGINNLEELDPAKVTGARILKERTTGIMGAIEKITAVEKHNSAKGKELLDNLGKEIKKLNQGKKVNQAYVPKPQQMPSYFFDKKK